MDKKFLLMSLSIFAILGLVDESSKAEPYVPLVRQAPSAAIIEEAYENCRDDHNCELFERWSVKAFEACSNGGEKACEVAKDLLAEITEPQKSQSIYDEYKLDPFKKPVEHEKVDRDDCSPECGNK